MTTQDTEQGELTNDLDEELKAAWEAAEDVDESTEETSEEEEAATPPEEEAGGESDEEPEEGESEEQEDDSEGEEESAQPTVQPPEDWPEEWREKLETLESDDARQLLIDQYKKFQADYTRKTQDVAEVKKALEPISEELSLRGMSEGQYVRQLTAMDRYLTQNPVDGLQKIMQHYGVSPEHLAGSGEDDDLSDPEVSQLKSKIQELEGKLQQRDQQQEQASQQQIQQQVQEFANERDEQGNLKRPHFEQLKTAMGGLLQSGHATTLEDAYEQAKWADPQVREQLLKEQTRQASENTEKQRKKKAQKAKKARTPSTSAPTGGEQEQPKDLRSELEEQLSQLS